MREHWIVEAPERIREMEQIFDALQTTAADNPAALREDALLNEQLLRLTRYYESGQWLRDYELDEAGLLPPDLKRGILSQDAVFDFLEQVSAEK